MFEMLNFLTCGEINWSTSTMKSFVNGMAVWTNWRSNSSGSESILVGMIGACVASDRNSDEVASTGRATTIRTCGPVWRSTVATCSELNPRKFTLPICSTWSPHCSRPSRSLTEPGISAFITTPVLLPPTNIKPRPFPSFNKSIISTCDHSVLRTIFSTIDADGGWREIGGTYIKSRFVINSFLSVFCCLFYFKRFKEF